MKKIFERIETQLKTLDENLDFLVSNKNNTEEYIEELYCSVLNLRNEFKDYSFKLAIYKEKHIDKSEVYRKKLDNDYITERIFLNKLIEQEMHNFDSKKFVKISKEAENLCTDNDLDIYVFKIYEKILEKFEDLICKCKEALKK